MKKASKTLYISCIILLLHSYLIAQKKEVKGVKAGVLPAISYSSDQGFQYGALTQLFWYGDGSIYPKYHHTLYLEASRYTSGGSLLKASLKSFSLIPNKKIVLDAAFTQELLMDFYGFNGRSANYNTDILNQNATNFISPYFYYHHRDQLRIVAQMEGNISQSKALKWQGGITLFSSGIKDVEFDNLKLSSSKKSDYKAKPSLYSLYKDWGIVTEDEESGGNSLYLKSGISYDTRDVETNTSKGIWSELIFSYAPSQLSQHESQYSRLTFTHRQYFTLKRDKLILAYRIIWQHKLSGEIPFYLLPHIVTSDFSSATFQGLGSNKTIRGMKRNRVVGDGFALSNIELRYKFLNTLFLKQNFYLATNLFTDIGIITQKHNISLNNVPDNYRYLFNDGEDQLHTTYGIGLKAAFNENFVISIDYGQATNKQDGTSAIYTAINYLF